VLQVGGPPEGLREQLLSVAGVVGVQASPLGADFMEITCQVASGGNVEARIARSVASRWDLRRLERREPTLESIFLRYVGGKA